MRYFTLSFLLISFFLFAKGSDKNDEIDISKVSEGLGYLIGKNLENLGVPLDFNLIAKGMQNAHDGNTSPISEDECYLVINNLQENALKEKAVQNLKEAEDFLAKNGLKKGVHELEKNKLQFEILKEGNGNAVKAYNSPLIRYTGKYLNGDVFGSSTEAELISLDETIDGFQKGIVGMKEGEKRILYIHPDLGYGKTGFLTPNSLLLFEIELIQADATNLSEKTAQGMKEKVQKEIAVPGIKEEKKFR